MAAKQVLVGTTCASRAEAELALAALGELDVEVVDAVVVVRTVEGRVELHQTRELAAGEGIVAGGAVGLVAGMLLGGPVAGALLGMLGGGAWGARDTGVENDRLRELGEVLEPGAAMLCVLVDAGAVSPIREVLASYGDVAVVEASAGP